MSGKYQKKNPKKEKGKSEPKKKGRVMPGVLVALFVLVAVLAFVNRERPAETPETTQATGVFTQVVPSEFVMASTAVLSEMEYELGLGMEITKIGKYSGVYMEDGSDDVVSDILMVMVTNTGAEYIQYATFHLTDGNTTASFSLSTLMPGQSMVVLESNRMVYSTAPEFTSASLDSISAFDQAPGMCDDRISIQSLNGIMNITNISDSDIDGDVVIYYKNVAQGVYYGGITYRIRIAGGLKAGEVRQVASDHYTIDGSTVVFVTCG